ncbi:hypothetical protein [Paractinoplanes durhamensis]|uniref:Transmembrane protein n=1 Tax=Paractinoplanes durhamensis TaxID=113563 RepID=A0ABQ3YNY7_9ACTN|nr:hypothetical protein [Actinoplanes durhamensis]GID99294.1 hypothetical protein Adu01nite_06450 [Actinoplanes durhamensis]
MPDSKTTVPSLVASAWRTAPPVLRRFAYWDWGIGLVAAGVSVAGDAFDWWGNMQFTSNLLAEAICGMLALPIALVIIRRLAEYQVRELDRARLDERYATIRTQMAVAVRATRDNLQEVEQEVFASTDAFAGAIKDEDGILVDPDLANETARILHAQMDSQQWILYERMMAPLRIVGSQLQSLLVERDRNDDLTDETTKFAELWIELESALAQQKQTMANGHDLFGNRPAVTALDIDGAKRLRDVAIKHLKGVDRLLDLCDQLEAYASPGSLPPAVRS